MAYKKWTSSELDFIKENFNTISDDEIATKLSEITNSNITTAMIRRQRRKLNINKQRGRPKKLTTLNNNNVENLDCLNSN